MALLTPVAAASPIGDADNSITAAWKDAGGDNSDLGAKQGDCYVAGQGFAQDFLHGKMFFTPATGPRLMMGAILDKYEALGGPAASDLGFPTANEVRGLAGPDSRLSTFSASDKPLIYWTADHGAFVVRGAINAAWDKLGSSGGALGVPTGDETFDGELATPDTWEVALSSGKGDKRAHWERLLVERKLGALALLRNLRNMKDAKVDEQLVVEALGTMKTDRVLPFRFLAAARYAPQWEEALEAAMFRSVADREKLAGHTVLLVDVSGSMVAPLSRRSEMLRTDAAYGLAVLLREIAERVSVYTFSNAAKLVPPRRGFALRDAMETSQPHSGTMLGAALDAVKEPYDRIIVITDEQSHDRVAAPKGKGYVINVASAQNGVGYGKWSHIDGWSEAVIEYIRELERSPD